MSRPSRRVAWRERKRERGWATTRLFDIFVGHSEEILEEVFILHEG